MVAAVTSNRLQDERDLTIRLLGYRGGYFAFVSCVMLGLSALWPHTALGQLNPKHMAVHF